MNLSRALLLVPLAALTAACGSSNSVVPSAGEAHTMACRSYVLTVGDSDTKHAEELVAEAPYSGDDIQTDAILTKVRTAAASSGATAGLAAGDYARFRKLVEVIDGLPDSQTTTEDGASELSATVLQPLATAVAAVHKLCY